MGFNCFNFSYITLIIGNINSDYLGGYKLDMNSPINGIMTFVVILISRK